MREAIVTGKQRLRRQLRKELQQRPCPNRCQRSRQACIASPQSRNLQQRRNQQRIARIHHTEPRDTASHNNNYRAINSAHVSCRSHHIRHQCHVRVNQLIRPNTKRWYSEDAQPKRLVPSPRHLFTQNLHDSGQIIWKGTVLLVVDSWSIIWMGCWLIRMVAH